MLKINHSSIGRNYHRLRKVSKGRCMAVIKGNAFGHGLVETATELHRVGVDALGVATIVEGKKVRQVARNEPIVIMSDCSDSFDWRAVHKFSFEVMVHSIKQVSDLCKTGSSLNLWLMIDTGIHREGLKPEETTNIVDTLQKAGHKITAIASHFLAAEDYSCAHFISQYRQTKTICNSLGLPMSIANSAGLLRQNEWSEDWSRPGLSLYGASPFVGTVGKDYGLEPSMSLYGYLMSIKEVPINEGVGYGWRWRANSLRKIGLILIGYGDGYPRLDENKGFVQINGSRAPIVGVVSMDMVTIDVTDIVCKVGDTVEFWGENIAIETVASAANTIANEIMVQSNLCPRRIKMGKP